MHGSLSMHLLTGARRVQGAAGGTAADAQPPAQPAPADASARSAASGAGSAPDAAEASAQADAGAGAAASAPAGAPGHPVAEAAASGAHAAGEQAGAGAALNPAEALNPAARARAAAEAALAAAKGAASGTAAAQHGKVTVTETRRFAGKEIQARAAEDTSPWASQQPVLCLHWLDHPWVRCRVTMVGSAETPKPYNHLSNQSVLVGCIGARAGVADCGGGGPGGRVDGDAEAGYSRVYSLNHEPLITSPSDHADVADRSGSGAGGGAGGEAEAGGPGCGAGVAAGGQEGERAGQEPRGLVHLQARQHAGAGLVPDTPETS